MSQITITYLDQFTDAYRVELIKAIHDTENTTMLQGQAVGWSTPKMEYHQVNNNSLSLLMCLVAARLNKVSSIPRPVVAWFVGVNPYGSLAIHDHHQSDWVAVYYPQCVDKDEGGAIVFESGEIIQPKTNMLVIFPGTLKHHVTEYNGSTARLSVAFNRLPSPS